MRLAPFVAVFAAAGCGETPCTTQCPAIGGTYAMSYGQSEVSTGSICSFPAGLAPGATLVISQTNGDLSAPAGTFELHGQVADDGSFALNAQSSSGAVLTNISFAGQLTLPAAIHGHFSESESVDPSVRTAGSRTGFFADCALDATFDGLRSP
jgi:hypothetical protein